MTSRIEKILDVLDVGLQTPAAPGYGTDVHPDRCARCRATAPADGGELCEGCRAFLLGDTDEDPKARAPGAPGAPMWAIHMPREHGAGREAQAHSGMLWAQYMAIRPPSARITDITES